MPRTDLVWVGSQPVPVWSAGTVWACEATVASLARALADASLADQVLLWDARLGVPDASHRLDGAVDSVHAGLRLGTGGLPHLIDYVHPTWMLNCDPDPRLEATSWRMSWRAALIRGELLRQLGGLDTRFDGLDAAVLELGYRVIKRGGFVRHRPSLAPAMASIEPIVLSAHDELVFARRHFGRKWTHWAVARAVASGHFTTAEATLAYAATRGIEPCKAPIYRRILPPAPALPEAKVTVLLPTIERYPYLRTVLTQLRTQTVKPFEIIVIDQTPVADRDHDLARDFADLPLVLMHMDRPGQCSSRNAGLLRSRGDHVLFIDDDDEIEPDLIERHLRTMTRFGVGVSSGVAHEVGAGEIPPDFRYMRVADGFPTNNTMVHRDVLRRSGLFDLAYDRMPRADGDLGMRVYLSGELMVLDPEISVLHHHAPRGGLRQHNARVVTYAASRAELTKRILPAPSEIYLGRRYFSSAQVKEMLFHRALGTLSARGQTWRRGAKSLIGLAQMPGTVRAMQKAEAEARRMLTQHPTIETLA